MAQTDLGAGAWGGGMGALGGAGTGASVGFMFGGPPGALLGAGIGAGVGFLGGAITGLIDNKAQRELERAVNEQLARIEKADRRFQADQLAAGDAAQEALTQTMTVKNAQDQSKADQVIQEASQQADSAGFTPAEKADFVMKSADRARETAVASDPAVYQQALGGVKQLRANEIQKAAMLMQSRKQDAQNEITRLQTEAGQRPSAQAGFGQVMGGLGEAASAAAQVDLMRKQTDALNKLATSRSGGALGGTSGARVSPLGTPMTDAEVSSYGQLAGGPGISGQEAYAMSSNPALLSTTNAANQTGGTIGTLPDDFTGSNLGGTTTAAAPVATSAPAAAPAAAQQEALEEVAAIPSVRDVETRQAYISGTGEYNPSSRLRSEWPTEGMEGVDPDLMSVDELMGLPTNYGQLGVTPVDANFGAMNDPNLRRALEQQGFSYASGGMAGATGPEVAVLGEEGPELVLNAKQTAELAQALGGAKPLAEGGVAGADKKKMKGYAGGGVAGMGQQPEQGMSYEELMEYMTTLNDQFKGAL